MSPGRLWWLLRRDLARGISASKHHYRTLPRIRDWSWPFWNEAPQKVPVHVLTGAKDWELAAWMLASFFHFTEHAWPVVIHDDGTLPEEGKAVLTSLFTRTRFISRKDADKAMEKALKPFPFCYEYRGMHPLALKSFDMAHFAGGQQFIVLDSDVLFFSYPTEIMQWAKQTTEECWFNADVQEGSLLSQHEAVTELGVDLWPRVNSGLGLIYKPAMDLDLCDRALAQTTILRGHIWRVEQTLFALCGSNFGRGGLLPARYEVSLGKWSREDAVARHYVGAVRDRFYGEGLKRIAPELLAKER